MDRGGGHPKGTGALPAGRGRVARHRRPLRHRARRARASDARRRAGTLRGPLDGVPVFAKSIYDMEGLPTTGSSCAEWAAAPLPRRRASGCARVRRLRAAGAIVLARRRRMTLPTVAWAPAPTPGRWPIRLTASSTRTPGGSSAGSAVAVADGMAFAALGTDDGGSNRIPAVCTGVVGMKPTFGLVPRTGVIPTWPYLDTPRPAGTAVADAALLLAAIAGPDGSDPLALAAPFRREPPAPLARRRARPATALAWWRRTCRADR